MRILFLLAFLVPLAGLAQDDPNQSQQSKQKKQKTSLGFGIKAGVNFANVRDASSINTSNQSGFMGGAFMAPPSGGIMGFRTEFIYSKQGYNFSTQTNTGSVSLDYIILPQLMTISITKFFQLQFGGQMAFLLNAKSDTTKSTSSGQMGSMMDMYNKFDYGFAGGVEIRPIKGLIIGARLNVSMANMYKDPSSFATGTTPAALPKVEAKNNVLQLSAGWIF